MTNNSLKGIFSMDNNLWLTNLTNMKVTEVFRAESNSKVQ